MKATYLLRQTPWLDDGERRTARYLARHALKALAASPVLPSPLAASVLANFATSHAVLQRLQRRLVSALDTATTPDDFATLPPLAATLSQAQATFLDAHHRVEQLLAPGDPLAEPAHRNTPSPEIFAAVLDKALQDAPAAPALQSAPAPTMAAAPSATPAPTPQSAPAPATTAASAPAPARAKMPAFTVRQPTPLHPNSTAGFLVSDKAADDAAHAVRQAQEAAFERWRKTPEGSTACRPGALPYPPELHPDSIQCQQARREAANAARAACRAEQATAYEAHRAQK